MARVVTAEAAAAAPGDGQGALWLDIEEPQPSFEVMRGPDRPLLVVSLGVGRDSTALLILLWKMGIRPDVILFADTVSEKKITYAYLPILSAWLRRVGFPEVTVVRLENRKGDPSLAAQMLRRGRVPSIAFNSGGCSDTWKASVQQQHVKALPAAQESWRRNRRVVFAIGYEAGECGRVRKATTYTAQHPSKHFLYWYPLVEAGLDLADCIELIESVGLPVPQKSACYCCPSSKPHEVEWLAVNEPAHLLRGLVIEARALPELTTIKGLGGREFRWRDLPCAQPFVEAADRIAAELPPPERDRNAQTSERLRAAIERVLAIDDEEARALAA